jgi:N-methylhydantoinase B
MGGCSIGGFRPDGRRFLLMNIFGGGWGGRPHEDGESASVSICQGDVRSAPIELQEIQYPFLSSGLPCARSGGAGSIAAGGVDLTCRALQKCVANVATGAQDPWAAGGRTRRRERGRTHRRDGSEQKLRRPRACSREATG